VAGSNVRAGNTSTQIVNFGAFTVSQFQPIVERAAKSINAIPHGAVKGLKRNPFALMFTGLWSYLPKLDGWRPKMLLPSLQIGVNGDGGDVSKLGSTISGAANKSAAVRVFKTGDRRLGRYAKFLTRYPVQLKSGKVVMHYALACETYHEDALGRIVRKIDQDWLEGLAHHVFKTGLVLPPLKADLDAAVSRVDEQITRIDERMRQRSAPRDELEIRRAQLVTLREKMTASFEEQFPDADKLSDDLREISFNGDADGQSYEDAEDDDSNL
jgi:hypothetical protein